MVFGGASAALEAVPARNGSEKAENAAPLQVPSVDAAVVKSGGKLFAELSCQSCHRMEGKGGISGPDLTHEARRHAEIAWHIAHLKDPQKIKPGSNMPPFDTLPPNDLKALAAFLSTRK